MFDHALVEYTINTGNAESLYKFIYNLSINKLSTVRDNLEEFLEKGYIQRLTSPAGAPILFIFKKDGGLRIYVNYRGLNKIIKKNRHLLSLIKKNAGSTPRNSNIYKIRYPRYLSQNKD